MKKIIPLIVCLMLTLSACRPNPEGIEATMREIVSAHTLSVIVNNQGYTLRLMGLDVKKEEDTQIITDIKNFLTNNGEKSLPSVKVIVASDLGKKDRFGRISGYVWCQQGFLNQFLLQRGRALVNLDYTDGKYDQQLLDAQTYARVMKIGIWQ
ncbi:MAG: thermonuclease family protein [Cyanobacterium sp. T60_A2020_053]|nr:thermonuclease family protein [Cyanobacterium sp. T60_A2020_053]